MNYLKNILLIIIFGILAIALSGGCAITGNTASDWIGRSESDLIAAWGKPDNITAMEDGRKVLTWTSYDDTFQVVPCRQSFTISTEGKIEKFISSNCEAKHTMPFYRKSRRPF